MALTGAVLEERFALTHLAFLLLLRERLCGLCQLWHLARVALGRKGSSGPPTRGAIAWASYSSRRHTLLFAAGGGRPYGPHLGQIGLAPVPHQAPPRSAQARPWLPPSWGWDEGTEGPLPHILPGRGDSPGL